ncbi:MAG: hypothetical protein WCV90_06375 [Candidatus Woesearchaeota archaeon]
MINDNLEIIVERREIRPERDIVVKQLGVDFIDQGINRGFFGWIRARIDHYLDSESRTLAVRKEEFFRDYATTYTTLFGNGNDWDSLRSMDQTKIDDTPQASSFSGLSQKHRDAIIIDKIVNVLETTEDQFVAGLFRGYLSHDLMCSDAVHQLIMGYEPGQEFSWRSKPRREITLHQEGEYSEKVICRSEETKRLTRDYPIEDTFGEAREYFATCNRAMELARHYLRSPAQCTEAEMGVLAPFAAIAARDGEWRGIELEWNGTILDFQQHLDGNMLGRLGEGIKRLQEANIVDLQYHQDKVYLLPTEGFIQLTRERLGR